MSNKKQDKAKITFVGMSSEDVTGSMHLVEYGKTKILLDAGFYQCKDKVKQYNMNNRNLKFKIKKVDAILLSHLHLDHYGNLAHLFNLGCKATIYAPIHTKEYLEIAFEDGLKIHDTDLEFIDKRVGKKHKPLYTYDDIQRMLSYIVEVDFDRKIRLDENIKVRFQPAYHILMSAQIEIFIRDEKTNYQRKIYYSGDLGNISIKDKPFLNGFKFIEKSDIAIVETTYSMNNKRCDLKTRNKDIEKLDTTIRETCVDNKGKVIIGSFATQRTQELLIELYKIHNNKGYGFPIVLDSPLAIKVTRMHEKMCEGEDKIVLGKILEWSVLNLCSSWKESEKWQNKEEPMVIVACSGFGEAGRVRDWFKKEIPNPNSTIVFIGYSSEESLSGMIKEGKPKYKYLWIDDEKVDNNAKVVNLLSFSSHMQHKDMIKTYSDMNVNEIYLVHSEMGKRLQFAQELEDEYRKKNKTTKVYIGMKDMDVTVN